MVVLRPFWHSAIVAIPAEFITWKQCHPRFGFGGKIEIQFARLASRKILSFVKRAPRPEYSRTGASIDARELRVEFIGDTGVLYSRHYWLWMQILFSVQKRQPLFIQCTFSFYLGLKESWRPTILCFILTLYTTSIAVVILLCIKQERDIYKIRVLVLEAALGFWKLCIMI